jgi:transcription elongation factor Elf1
MRLSKEKANLLQTPCPRCGEAADYSVLDGDANLVEVICRDCGRFEMPQEEFDQAVSDISEEEDRR